MADLKTLGALAISMAVATAVPAMAQHGGHGGGGGHGAAIGGGGGGFRGAAMSGGGFHSPSVGNSAAVSNFRGAQAGMGPSQVNRNFASNGRLGNGYGRNWHRGYGPGVGFATGLAAGSAFGYGYDDGYYGDNYAYNDYSDAGGPSYYYGSGDLGYVVSSNDDPGSCAQRYKSYDPASGTYLGYDGLRHPCE